MYSSLSRHDDVFYSPFDGPVLFASAVDDTFYAPLDAYLLRTCGDFSELP